MKRVLGRRALFRWFLLACVAILAAGLFLIQSRRLIGFGFPLDDSWIHQTYARNLVRDGVWAFNRQQPSSGSTAPAWTLILSVGYLAEVQHEVWSYALGTALLVLTAGLASAWFMKRSASSSLWAIALAGLVAAEWHLVWAALSGMETIASALVVVLVLSLAEGRRVPAWALGVLIGLGIWVRPDAATLYLPVLWVLYLRGQGTFRSYMLTTAQVVVGTLLVLIPYFMLNFSYSGSIWPSTYYAKQAEYAVLRESPILHRLAALSPLPLVGVGAVLTPGFLFGAARDLRLRRWWRLAPLVWAGGLVMLYALRLPVSYQHGRYLMPVIPVLMVVGMEGMQALTSRWLASRWGWVLARAWQATAGAVAAVFLVLGSRAYARDVAIIESEMVATARWISSHTESQALVAAHDIGALGYFGERRILDLAGLIDPQVIPILRNEAALANYLDEQGADYLMTFPDWYPELTSQAALLFKTEASFSPGAGGENMAVYRWKP